MAQATPPVAFNKFNSLDRRTLARRHQTNNNLKLLPSGAESLPPPAPSHFVSNNNNNDKGKEPERRHSNRFRSSNSNGIHVKGDRLSAMNINGLPDPFSKHNHNYGPIGQNQNQVYSSQESLNRGSRTSAGTPQFQNLSGAVRVNTGGTNQGRNLSLTNLNTSNPPTSIARNHHYYEPHQSLPNNHAVGHVGNATNQPPQQQQPHHHAHASLKHDSSSSSRGSSTTSGSAGQTGSDVIIMNQTPSPSDSAVCDLETMLKEKDTEINYLRETMEQNEQVIFKVGAW